MAKDKRQKAGKAAEQEEMRDSKQVEDIRAEGRLEVTRKIEAMTVDQFRDAFGGLYAKIANDVLEQPKDETAQKAPGFLLETDDPFGRGVEKVFVQNAGVGVPVIVRKLEKSRLPMIMPYKDPATKIALKNYLHRVESTGDIEKTQRAKAALQKCK